jgi:hypothetical protein
VRLEASSKLHVHNLIHEFLINMAFTMACPNYLELPSVIHNVWGNRRIHVNIQKLDMHSALLYIKATIQRSVEFGELMIHNDYCGLW